MNVKFDRSPVTSNGGFSMAWQNHMSQHQYFIDFANGNLGGVSDTFTERIF